MEYWIRCYLPSESDLNLTRTRITFTRIGIEYFFLRLESDYFISDQIGCALTSDAIAIPNWRFLGTCLSVASNVSREAKGFSKGDGEI